MHSVNCGDPPPWFEEWANGMKSRGCGWKPIPDLYRALEQGFRRQCAYCQRPCIPPYENGNASIHIATRDTDNRIDHFRPRHAFQELTFDWDNLMYCCRKCNEIKGGKFPGKSELTEEELNHLCKKAEKAGKRYSDPDEKHGYVNPRDKRGSAKEFFTIDEQGKIRPNAALDNVDWSKAARTIHDLDLNRTEGEVRLIRALRYCLGQYTKQRLGHEDLQDLQRVRDWLGGETV